MTDTKPVNISAKLQELVVTFIISKAVDTNMSDLLAYQSRIVVFSMVNA